MARAPLVGDAAPLTPNERRARNRHEMTEAIVAAARAIMQQHGVAALNLNEVARRVKLRPQSLAEYFPTKAALHDALYARALTVFLEGDERAYRAHSPGWAQIEAWFANRIALADANPDLYQLGFTAPFPDYVHPHLDVMGLSQQVLGGARHMVEAAVAAGAMAPAMPIDRATDLLLSIRHGLIAERLGKRPFLPPGSDRFTGLVPDVIRILQVAWAPAPPVANRSPSPAPETDGRIRRGAMAE